MTNDTQVQKLLDEIFDSDRTPEEVCGACPELLPEVRRRWKQMRIVEKELDVLFPTPAPDRNMDRFAPWEPGAELPRIPGYAVEAVIGRGGMGIVYKARDLRLNRLVALKMLLAGAYAGVEEQSRFLREAEALAGLRHPNIVQIHGAGDHNGRPYFTMEYVEGGSLAQRLTDTPQSPRQAAALLTTLAEAVQAAHQGGIVHRDLKPANILLTDPQPRQGQQAGEHFSWGVPKIADFGVARHFNGDASLTMSGARVGTPSYMAPEQAIGKLRTIGPAADIYALGAIFYEMLTGRPPFRGETAAETEQQVIAEEPVPPSRLNAKVPRDLETICLKCLHKLPQRRYASAAALAADLHRFQQGKPIIARPAGLPERTGKWVRRHPTATVLLAASLLLVAALVGVTVRHLVQETHQRVTVEADLKELAGLQDSARWGAARAVLERAEARLGNGGPEDLRWQLGQAHRDLDLVMKLDKIRLTRVTRGELPFYKTQANQQYADIFQQEGLAAVREHPANVAQRVRNSAVRGALVAALDDWSVCLTDNDQRLWLAEVARQADPDPADWRERILDPQTWDDPVALTELAKKVPITGQPVSLLLALAERQRAAGGEPDALLKRVQREHPADFWANLILGNALLQREPREASGYFRAALASRPGDAVGYCAVGDALRLQHLLPAATEYYEKALQLDPQYARAYGVLGLTCQEQGRVDEAIDLYQHAVQLDPDYAWAHSDLANALRGKGQFDEAYDHSQQALRLDPMNVEARKCLICVLFRKGRGSEALADWRQALSTYSPSDPDVWNGFAELCLFLGHEDEYCRVRQDLLARFGETPSPYKAEPLGRCCLLLPGTEEELRQAVALTDRAVAAKDTTPAWIYRYFLFAKGMAEYRQGHLANAITIMKGDGGKVMGASPKLIVAMAQYRLGQQNQARKTLAAAISAADWSAPHADKRDVWINHILRREAEALMLPNRAAFLQRNYYPRDNDERLALMGVCQFQGLDGTGAQMYVEAFATDAALADNLTFEHRFRAARFAALVGCGLSKEATRLSDAEQRRWRKQARDWLQIDLRSRASVLADATDTVRAHVVEMLMRWQAEPDLAGLRDPSALEKWSADERQECLALWNEVAGVLKRAREMK